MELNVFKAGPVLSGTLCGVVINTNGDIGGAAGITLSIDEDAPP